MENIFASVAAGGVYYRPALFVRGALSDYIPEEDLGMIRRLFPRSELVTIPGAGHWLHADQPDLLCKAFSEFLDKECTFKAGQP
jgi:pimeloyl-ACP methyl ester carboxylesterase